MTEIFHPTNVDDIVAKCPYCGTKHLAFWWQCDQMPAGARLPIFCNGDGPVKCGRYFFISAHKVIKHNVYNYKGELVRNSPLDKATKVEVDE